MHIQAGSGIKSKVKVSEAEFANESRWLPDTIASRRGSSKASCPEASSSKAKVRLKIPNAVASSSVE